MDAKELAQRANVGLWKVYYVKDKLKLNRLPTIEEITTYSGKIGRPLKSNNGDRLLFSGTIDDVILQLDYLKKHYGGKTTIKYVIEMEKKYE